VTAADAYSPDWWLILNDVAEGDDLSSGAHLYLTVTSCRDPADRHVRIGDVRLTPTEAHRLARALTVAAVTADETLD
jgi:hypothetical protein